MQNYKTGAFVKNRFGVDQINQISESTVLNSSQLEFINGTTTLDSPYSGTILFQENYSDHIKNTINKNQTSNILYVLSEEFKEKITKPYIVSNNPRSIYSKIVSELFEYNDNYWSQESVLHADIKIHKSAHIGNNVIIGRGSEIEEGVYLYPNVVIGPKCYIGRDTVIRPNSVIGFPGFGTFKGNDNNEHMPHIGGVVIENNVEIGALTTIVSGTIHPTVVREFSKIDDHVHIAHNVDLGSNSVVVAFAGLGGSTTVGEHGYLGFNSTVRESIDIGKNAFVGMGSNVVKNVEEGTTVIGNPAKKLR